MKKESKQRFYAIMFKHSTGWVPYIVEAFKSSAQRKMKLEMEKSPDAEFKIVPCKLLITESHY
jgi:hypothetical protein